MRVLWFGLSFVVMSALCACEFHAGDADFDASWPFDDEDSGAGESTKPRDAGRDTGTGTMRDAGTPRDEDAGETPPDAAMSGPDAAQPDASQPDAMTTEPLDASQPDGSQPDATTEPGTLTPDDVAAVMARGSCGALERCMGADLLRDSLAGKDCVAFRTQAFKDRDFHWVAKSVEQKHIMFDGVRLAQCEKDLVALGCDVLSKRAPNSCKDALFGGAGLDQSCAIDQECAGATVCDKGMLETCPGSCAALQTSGLPCSASSQCESGLVCRASSCTKPLVAGDACTARLGYGECSPGLVCQGTGANLKCQTIASIYVGKLNDACDGTNKLCATGLVCQSRSAMNTQGVCVAPMSAGQTCRPAVPSQCPVDQYCKDARDNVSTRAPAGTDGRCADLPSDGAACDVNIGCKPSVICSSDDMKCHALKTDGETCDESRECYGGLCQGSKCAPPLDCNAQ
jgi:hypothetical protein